MLEYDDSVLEPKYKTSIYVAAMHNDILLIPFFINHTSLEQQVFCTQ